MISDLLSRVALLGLVGLAGPTLGCFGEGGVERPSRGGSRGSVPSGAPDVAESVDFVREDEVTTMPDLVLDDSTPSRQLRVRESIDLAPLFPADAKLVGVAVHSYDMAGPRYVLEARTGL